MSATRPSLVMRLVSTIDVATMPDLHDGKDGGLIVDSRGADTAVVLIEAEEQPRALALSPDGRWLAYESRGRVFVRPFPDVSVRRIPVSLDWGRQPRSSRSAPRTDPSTT